MDKKKKGILAGCVGVAASAAAAVFIKKKVDSKKEAKEVKKTKTKNAK